MMTVSGGVRCENAEFKGCGGGGDSGSGGVEGGCGRYARGLSSSLGGATAENEVTEL